MKIKMHTITRSCVLFLWMQALAFVNSQDCTLEAFVKGPLFDSNLDISGLTASYPAGKQVRVRCSVGFTGLFKLICVKGEWTSTSERCQLKVCGHPGETQFGEFHLEIGDGFVFGSKVVYKCHTGYQMVSRINHRNCMAGGWDGFIPVCEVKTCSPVYVDYNVIVDGPALEATFAQLLRFSCKKSNEVLIGSDQMNCNEHGKWIGKKPTCEEIQCPVPVIRNGFVQGNVTVYKDQEVLRYQCNPGFKSPWYTESPKCTQQGQRAQWSPTPVCELINIRHGSQCRLPLRALTETSYEPAGESLFSPGDRVRVTCGENYWISNPAQTSVDTTCKDNGDWTIHPVCTVINRRHGSQCKLPLRAPTGTSYEPAGKSLFSPGDRVRVTCGENYWISDPVITAVDTTCKDNGSWTIHPVCRDIKLSGGSVNSAQSHVIVIVLCLWWIYMWNRSL